MALFATLHLFAARPAQAQTFTVLHSFTGLDGTPAGGSEDVGVIFKIAPQVWQGRHSSATER